MSQSNLLWSSLKLTTRLANGNFSISVPLSRMSTATSAILTDINSGNCNSNWKHLSRRESALSFSLTDVYRYGFRDLHTSRNVLLSTSNATDNTNTNSKHSFTGHNILIGDQRIHYEKAGHGSHVLLLLPGAIGTGKTDFLHQLTGLDHNLFTMIAWDPPGYGGSRPPEKNFDNFYRTDAAIAAKLMENLGYTRYSVLGWSDGGITGMILSSNEGRTMVQKLIIWGSNAYVNEEDRSCLLKVRNPKTDWSKKALTTSIELYGEEYFYRLWDRFVAHYITLNDICTKDLAKIDCPVLILHGDCDPMLATEHPVYLVNNIPNATLYRFPKGKHNIHQRYADEFNKLVEDFLQNE